MKIVNHRLILDDGNQARFERSPNQSAGINPRFLIIHYTAGGSTSGTVTWFKNPDAQASAHLVIGRDGGITQMVAFDRKAWHAGSSRWGNLTGLNAHSIGIELCNWGLLQGRPGQWRSRTGQAIADALVDQLEHKHGGGVQGWEIFPEDQINTLVQVATVICRKYDLEDVLGHDDIAPGRKVDPGPAFPMAYLKAKVMGREPEADRDPFVLLADANHRRWPSFFDNIIQVIPKDTRVDIIRSGIFNNDGSDNTWHLVEHNGHQGWVFGSLIG